MSKVFPFMWYNMEIIKRKDMKEYFKDIEGYEGLYSVSNLGRVKSLPKGDGNGYRERMLKQENIVRNFTTYKRVTLSKKGKTKRFSVHRLVAEAFVSNPENKPQVNHLDSNGSNNNAENLEWCTASENIIHSYDAGRKNHVFTTTPEKTKLAAIKRRKTAYNEYIGKTFGKWKVLSIYGLFGKKQAINMICECLLCNEEHRVDLSNLKNGKSKMCRSCALKISYKNRQ